MNNQFYRLYFFIIVAAALIFWAFSKLYDSLSTQQYLVSANSILSAYQSPERPTVKLSELSIQDMPSDLATKLKQGEVVAFHREDKRGELAYYYQLNEKAQLVEFGPVLEMPQEDNEEIWLLFVFYSALALLLVFLLKPIFIDLQKLQDSATEFSKSPKALDSDISEGSSIYPLANTFTKMSSQIAEFIDLHKDLSRTIAHEIRTPLSRMKFVSEALSSQIDHKHYQRLQSDISEIEELVEDYLSFARMESQEDLFEKTEQNILLWLSGQISKLTDNEYGISISLECEDDFAFFQSKFLERAVQNLIVNAFHFATEKIKVKFHIRDEQCYLEVIDDGPGLPKNSKNLFTAFKRKASDQRYEGFGLGLYITRKVAIWHGGKISTAESKQLGGAKFVIEWPNCP